MTDTTVSPNGSAGSSGSADFDLDEVFRGLLLEATLSQEGSHNAVADLIADHLGIEATKTAQAALDWGGGSARPLFQAGLDAFLAEPGRTHELIGAQCPIADPWFTLSLSKLLTPESLNWPGATLGSPTWDHIQVGYKRTLRCLFRGLIFMRDAEGPAVLWVSANQRERRATCTVAVADSERAKRIVDRIAELAFLHTPYAGELIDASGSAGLIFMPKPMHIGRDEVILPPTLLDRIDQHTVGISFHRERLVESGQHLKRGLLLYGPPGTGKTHTIRYLISQLPEETTVLLQPNIHMLPRLIPRLGPSVMIVLDDVDNIAGDRSLPGVRTALFMLLDVLDGLHAQGEVLFVLTTNRLAALEPAVAARPGRIDEALEVPRPDADCRRRLFGLYRRGMDLRIGDDEIEQIIERTDGVTASLFKELMRRATVVAVENGSEVAESGLAPVQSSDVFQALDEMLDPNNPTTRLLLGAEPEHRTAAVRLTEESNR